jgi:tetratricopeptide (TPR) repeat protein
MNDKKRGQAMAMLDKAIELDPNEISARSIRATLHLVLGNKQQAVADADAALKLDPLNVGARSMHARLMLALGNRTAAIADAQALADRPIAQAQIERARILAQCDRVPDALAALDLALKYEADPLTHAFRAGLLAIDDKAGRRRELDAGLKLDPRDPAALTALAGVARDLGDFDSQVSLLDKAFLLAPDSLEIRGQRAVALAQAGRTKDAEREFEAIAAKDLTAPDWNNQCWFKAVASVELIRALDECDKSIAAQDLPATHDSRALVLLRLERFADAIAAYDAALAAGDIADALYGRSIAYARIGKKPESDADAAKAMSLDPLVARRFALYGLKP